MRPGFLPVCLGYAMTHDSPTTPAEVVLAAADAFATLRERKPRVHVITNTVAQPISANLLIAAGAVPSMTVSPEEVPDFAARSDALLVNPYSPDELAYAIETALDMPLAERKRRWEKLEKSVREENITVWTNDFANDLRIIEADLSPPIHN